MAYFFCICYNKNMLLNEKKVELLSPAGDFDCIRAAINAGADAIYTGSRYGMRAFAKSVVEDKIVDSIKLCHKYGKKIYITLNSLIKDRELEDVVKYAGILMNAGVDAFIVSDIGLFSVLKNEYKNAKFHASTQMNITTDISINNLGILGFDKFILARELTLKEIEYIRKNTDKKLECFIHGSMCYSYSGFCYMSSFLGGNSGNRGRCKGPCRLKYKYKNVDGYILSMKDMCSVYEIKKLIDIGIDSFKIEGRMRSATYVAGVVSVYRKIIDDILNGKTLSKEILNNSISELKEFYDKGGFTNYFNEEKDIMVQVVDRNNKKKNEGLIKNVKDKYIQNNKKIGLKCRIVIKLNEYIEAEIKKLNEDRVIRIKSKSVKPEEAKTMPIKASDVIRQFKKTGNTDYEFESVDVDMEDNVFIPISDINKFRREVLDNDFS